jgi:glycosyltransferase involved in cell wall biosynthesis
MMEDSVSVVIPNYNRSEMVIETIENQFRQTLTPFEVIVVDDGSTDGSRDRIGTLYPSVILIEQENSGPGAARNAGLRKARGEFIQFMDSDDLASPNKLERQVAAMERHNADMAFCPWFHIEWGKGIKTSPKEVLQTQHPGEHRALLDWHLRGWNLVLQNCLFRRSFLEKIGPQRTDLLGTEDWEFFNRIFLAKPKAVFTPDCLVLYRLHDEGKLSGSGTTSLKKSEELTKAARYIQSNLNGHTDDISKFSKLLLQFRFHEIEKHGGSSITPEPSTFLEKAFFTILSFQDRIIMGLRRRIIGHAWNSFYYAERPNEKHFKMMNEAGINFPDKSVR